jgi:7,8-dihydroneopterin aldolase/epimerase/oxygenase
MTTIRVSGLEVYAYHGVPDAEQSVGHRYVADITLGVEEEARESDDISDTVNYAEVAAITENVLTGSSRRTLEFLANEIAKKLKDSSERIGTVSVNLSKITPPMPFICEAVSVEIELE